MFDLNIEKPAQLIFWNIDHLVYEKLEKLKPRLYKSKRYLEKRKEFEDLEKIDFENIKSKRLLRIFCDEFNSIIKYIENFETKKCKEKEDFLVLLETYYK